MTNLAASEDHDKTNQENLQQRIVGHFAIHSLPPRRELQSLSGPRSDLKDAFEHN